jgi:hypothetical protein
VLIAVSLFELTAFAQGPNTETPQQLILPWTDAEISKRAAACYDESVKLYPEIADEIAKYEKAVAGGKAKSLNLLAAGATRAKLGDAERYARRLTFWGEPAGLDLALRYRDLTMRWDRMWPTIVDAQKDAISRGYTKLMKDCDGRRKLLKGFEKLLADGKAEDAEKKYDTVYFGLHRMACWYEVQRREGPMKAFDIMREQIREAVDQVHQQEADETIAKLREELRPDFADLPKRTGEAAQALQTAATVTFGKGESDGPKVFIAAARQWYMLHRDMLRLVALTWADFGAHKASWPKEPAIEEYPKFCEQMTASLNAVILADAARAQAADAAQLHADYVKGIADMASILRDDTLLPKFADALDQLAEKSPELAADTKAYRGATDDWLRWRAKAAASAAATRRGQSLPLPQKVVQNPTLQGPGPQLLEEVAAELNEKEAFAGATYLVPTKSASPTSSLLEGCYVRVLAPELVQDATLAADLLTSDDHAPLSLTAAHALACNKRGNVAEAGGTISKITLAGLVPLFALDSDDRKALVTMGELPPGADGMQEKPMHFLRAAIELKPKWVRGEYFFRALE